MCVAVPNLVLDNAGHTKYWGCHAKILDKDWHEVTTKSDNLIIHYIYLAIGCGILGVVITFIVIYACQYFGVDMYKNLWVLAIPITLSAFLNVCFIELYRKCKKK